MKKLLIATLLASAFANAATHDYDLANATGSAFRADANAALAAIASNNSSPTAPTVTFAYQWWADTTTDTMKVRNAANTAWLGVFTLSTGSPVFIVEQAQDAIAAAFAAGTQTGITITYDDLNNKFDFLVSGGGGGSGDVVGPASSVNGK